MWWLLLVPVVIGCLIVHSVRREQRFIRERVPTSWEVGKATLTIQTVSGDSYEIKLEGAAHFERYDLEVHVTPVKRRVSTWLRQLSESSLVEVDTNKFVPLCNVKDVQVQYEEHQVTA